MSTISRPRRRLSGLRGALAAALLLLGHAAGALAQVHYHEDGRPWKQRADGGPDAEVDGWYYNLGITGLRVQLVPDRPKHLLVKHVFDGSPAARRVRVGDYVVGVGGKPFATEHRNGYGMEVFGPEGPILEFAEALEASQGDKGRLELELERKGKKATATLKVGTEYGTYSKTFPEQCSKSDKVLKDCCRYLAKQQRDDGSWGSPPHDLFAPLALLASGDARYLPLVEKCAKFHARTTSDRDESWLINWRYTAAAIVLAEYHLATGERWVVKELEEIYRFLVSSQYTDMSQINPKARETHPGSVPQNATRAHGGWGHNPGFEGYGPIAMITGQGALAFALMKRCGVGVDRKLHDAAYAFLERGTGKNGYVWYADEVAGDDKWADMGRTGAAGIANALSPYPEERYRERALLHAKVIGDHPQSFPDTHGSPIMGMGFAAMAARVDPGSFRKLMDANRWWFVLARCQDGSFYYQPNRDNAGYGRDSRISATAVTAFILAMRNKGLHVTGKPFEDR